MTSKFKTAAYAGLFGGVVAGFGGIIYALYQEVSETSGSYGMIQRAVSRVENDQRVIYMPIYTNIYTHCSS